MNYSASDARSASSSSYARMPAGMLIPSDRLLALGQNSISFSLLELLAISSVLQNNVILQKENSNDKPVVCLEDFWLDEVHESRLDTFWGQTVSDFPLFVREKIAKIKADDSSDFKEERITFRQFKKLRELIISDLEHCGVTVIRGKRIIKIKSEEAQSSSTADITVVTPRGNHVISKVAMIVNTLNTNRIHPLKTAEGHDLPPQTDLYKLEKGSPIQKLIVLGFGLSAVWVKEQFPITQIKYVVRDKSKLDYQEIARNKGTITHEMIENDIYETKPGQDSTVKALSVGDALKESSPIKAPFEAYLLSCGIDPATYQYTDNEFVLFREKTREILFVAPTYAAIGYEPNIEPVQSLENIKIINIHFQPSDDNNRKIISPKNLPLGALMDRFIHQEAKLAEALMWPLEQRILLIPMEILVFRPEHAQWLMQFFKEHKQLEIPIKYFDVLFNKVKALEDAPGEVQESLAIIKQTFAEVVEDDNSRHVFNTIIDDLFAQRIMLIDNAHKRINTSMQVAPDPIEYKSSPQVQVNVGKLASVEVVAGNVAQEPIPVSNIAQQEHPHQADIVQEEDAADDHRETCWERLKRCCR